MKELHQQQQQQLAVIPTPQIRFSTLCALQIDFIVLYYWCLCVCRKSCRWCRLMRIHFPWRNWQETENWRDWLRCYHKVCFISLPCYSHCYFGGLALVKQYMVKTATIEETVDDSDVITRCVLFRWFYSLSVVGRCLETDAYFCCCCMAGVDTEDGEEMDIQRQQNTAYEYLCHHTATTTVMHAFMQEVQLQSRKLPAAIPNTTTTVRKIGGHWGHIGHAAPSFSFSSFFPLNSPFYRT